MNFGTLCWQRFYSFVSNQSSTSLHCEEIFARKPKAVRKLIERDDWVSILFQRPSDAERRVTCTLVNNLLINKNK